MQKIRFPALYINLDGVPDNTHYINDGLVSNYWEHLMGLNERYGRPKYQGVPEQMRTEEKRREAGMNGSYMRGGGCVAFGNEREVLNHKFMLGEGGIFQPIRKRYIHTFVEDSGDWNENVFLLGHEQTHALIKLNALGALEFVLRDGMKIDSSSLRALPKEAICDVGGFHALSITNPDWFSLRFPTAYFGPEYEMARDWLDEQLKKRDAVNI